MNLLTEKDKPKIQGEIVVYAGRFQPFHKGHNDAYQRLVSKFGSGNVYIATSNDTSSDKSPFSFNEKKEIATKMFGVPSNKFIKVSNPYRPVEVLKKYDGQTIAYIAAVGDKDATRLQGKYFKPYKGKAGYGYDEIGYTYPIPAEANPISGTDVRKGLGSNDKEKAKKFFLKAYPKFDKDIFKMITTKLNEGFPGGIGVGLNLPGGYINGAPTGSVDETNNTKPSSKMRPEPHPTRHETEHPSNEPYDPIGEIINRVVSEEAFQLWVEGYFGEDANKELDVDISYTNSKGEQKKIKARNALRLPKDHPAHIQAAKIVGPDDAPANEPKKKEEPGKAAAQSDKPAEPGQPTKKDQTAQGKADKETGKEPAAKPGEEQGPPPEQKLGGTDLKSSAEKRADGETSEQSPEEKATKEKLDKVISEMSEQDQKEVKDVNDADSPVRQEMNKKADNWWSNFKKNTMVGRFIEKKAEQYKNTGKAINNLMHGRRMGSIVDPESGNHFHYSQVQETDENGKPVYDEKPVYKTGKKVNPEDVYGGRNTTFTASDYDKESGYFKKGDKHYDADGNPVDIKTGNQLDKDGKPIQDKNWYGKPKTKKEPRIMDLSSLSPDAKSHIEHLVHESQHAEHEQKHSLLHTGMEVGFLIGGVAMAGGLAAGAATVGKTIAKDLGKHATLETLGVSNPVVAGSAGLAAAHFTGHLLEGMYLNENSNEIDNHRLFSNIMEASLQKVKNYKLSDKQLLETLEKYQKDKPKQDLANLLKENISESKQNSINHFVEYATKRLKLKENPKVTLLTGREYSDAKTSLGGYNPMTKEIFVVVDGRLTADICRTIAHEMVHRKQDELGLVRNEVKDGADGSPIENQAHAIAGILMREYGRVNKQIYNEDINIDVDKGDTVLMGKFKNKKVVVKDFGKDDHGMPTINGKVATTFRLGDKGQNIFKKEIDEVGEGSSKPYSFTQRENQKDNKVYAFTTTSKEDYKVEFDYKDLRDAWEMEFDIYFGSGDKVINKGEIYSVMATVTNIALDFIKKVNPKIIYFRAAKNFNNDNRREKLYLAYIKKQLPNWTLGKHSGLTTLINPKYKNQPTLSEGLLLEGGAYGHMAHPFDDMDLTFGDLKDIITKALNGDLGVVREKTDGQALAISWKNGRLIAARNKGHLQNAGANAMGIEDVASKFGGRGGLTDAYNYAMKDLSAAISGLSEAQRKKIFNEGQCFMNLEVIWPTSVNVIPYGQALLVFHNTVCYDEKGTATGADGGAASTLAGMIKQVNADVQSKYTIQGPPITEIPKNENLSSKQGKYISRLKKLQSEFGLKDSDNVADYHQSWWDWWITSNAPIKVDKLTKEALIRRWAFGDKGFRLNVISNEELQKWAIEHDKVNVAKQQKDNIKPFEEIFLGVGADVLEFVGSVLTVHPEKAIRSMKQKFKSVASQVRNGGSPTQIQKLKSELERLNALGGIDKIVANEGLVFFYNGKTYKLTGSFAPLNQILGIFYS